MRTPKLVRPFPPVGAIALDDGRKGSVEAQEGRFARPVTLESIVVLETREELGQRAHLETEDGVAIDPCRSVELATGVDERLELTPETSGARHLFDAQVERIAI